MGLWLLLLRFLPRRSRDYPFRGPVANRIVNPGRGGRNAVGGYPYRLFADTESECVPSVFHNAVRTLNEGLQLVVPTNIGHFNAYVRVVTFLEVCILLHDPTVKVLLVARLRVV